MRWKVWHMKSNCTNQFRDATKLIAIRPQVGCNIPSGSVETHEKHTRNARKTHASETQVVSKLYAS